LCGRYYTSSGKLEIDEYFKAITVFEGPFAPNYNGAPKTVQPVLRLNRDTGDRELVQMRWELVPVSAPSESAINPTPPSMRGWKLSHYPLYPSRGVEADFERF